MNQLELMNSDIWIKYTQERYTPFDGIKYRLESQGYTRSDWPELKRNIQLARMAGMIPIPLKSINKNFWYYPSDSIQKKLDQINSLGTYLYKKVEDSGTFKDEFLINASVEEAVTSAIYEGANSSRAQAKKIISNNQTPRNKDEWMIVNNFRALQWIKSHKLYDIDVNTILKIHEIVTKNTLEGDDQYFYGKFRNDKVFVGSHEGIKYEKISECVTEAISAISNNPRYIHGLIKGILLHYFIAYIHPFFDGNGRTARTLFYFKSFKHDLKYVELLSISAHLKEHGKKYEKSFELVQEHDLDITYFIDFCLDSILHAFMQVERKIKYLLSIASLAETLSLNKNQIILLQKLALNKFLGVTSDSFSKEIGKTREMARKDLKQLHQLEILIEKKEGRKLVYYVNNKYLKQILAK